MNRKTHMTIIVSIMAIFFAIGFVVKNTVGGILFDISVLEYLHRDVNTSILKLTKFVSLIGSGKFLLPVIGIIVFFLLLKKKYYVSKLLLASTVGSYAINFILKMIFQRTRPLEFFRVNQKGFSFPSGHSMVTMSLYLMIAYILTRNERNMRKKRIIYGMSIIFVLLMGFSRIYLGVHWPTDVVGGYLVGYVVYYASTKIIEEND